MRPPTVHRPTLALLTTVVLWASAFPAIRVALDGYGAFALAIARLVVASLALAMIASRLGIRRPDRRDLPRIVGCAVAGMSSYQLLLNWGQLHVPAGTASMLVATVPVLSAVLAALFLGERFTLRIVVGSAFGVAGSVLIALSRGDGRFTAAAWVVLGAAVAQATYHAAIKPLLVRYTGFEVACFATWLGTLLLAPLAPWALHVVASAPRQATLAVLYLGLLPSAVGFVTWSYAVARTTVTLATSALYLVPLVALTIAYLWLGETPHVRELVGGAVIIVGVAVVRHRRPAAREHARPGERV